MQEHFTQRIKSGNIEKVRKLIATAMPTGIPDRKLRAAVGVTYGFSARTMNDYLELLVDLSIIEKVEGDLWRLVVVA